MITSSLLAEVRKLEGASVIGMDEIREMINFEAQRQAMGCDADEACMAQIAGALGVDEIITGRLTEGSDGRNLLIRRINQRRARPKWRPVDHLKHSLALVNISCYHKEAR